VFDPLIAILIFTYLNMNLLEQEYPFDLSLSNPYHLKLINCFYHFV